MNIRCSYKVTKWEEVPYDEISANSRLTKASVEYQCTGEMEGSAAVEYLLFYRHFDAKDQHNASAVYVGLIRFQGKIKDKEGSFVLIDNGAFQGGAAISALQIAAGSGTGSLQGISGTGRYRADSHGYSMELECEIG